MNDSSSENSMFDRMAKTDFEHALRKGYWRGVLSWLTQSTNDLLPFDEVRNHLPFTGQHDIGLQQINVKDIVGSVGRYQDFDRAFLPRQSHTRSRWISIDSAHLKDVILPPIEAYKLGNAYFVKDGNHRVSVARERGQVFIDAYVTEIDAPVPITPEIKIDDLILKQEYAEFLLQTKIQSMRPDAKIELTIPGQYGKLIEHINVHRWYLGEQSRREVGWEEAVARWYDEVYLPLVNIVREQNVLADFPNRTEADLYLWIIEHLHYLREEWQQEVTLEEATAHFTEEFSHRPLRRIMHLIRSAARVVTDGLT